MKLYVEGLITFNLSGCLAKSPTLYRFVFWGKNKTGSVATFGLEPLVHIFKCLVANGCIWLHMFTYGYIWLNWLASSRCITLYFQFSQYFDWNMAKNIPGQIYWNGSSIYLQTCTCYCYISLKYIDNVKIFFVLVICVYDNFDNKKGQRLRQNVCTYASFNISIFPCIFIILTINIYHIWWFFYSSPGVLWATIYVTIYVT